MSYLNLKTIGAACGVGFLAYCAYFDHKRRSAPDYREKVRARRERQRLARDEEHIELPQSDDKETIDRFFAREIELGEELLHAGEVDRAIKHLSYAIVFCPQPQQLLRYMHDVLPSTAYQKLLANLEVANRKAIEAFKPSIQTTTVQEEDVE